MDRVGTLCGKSSAYSPPSRPAPASYTPCIELFRKWCDLRSRTTCGGEARRSTFPSREAARRSATTGGGCVQRLGPAEKITLAPSWRRDRVGQMRDGGFLELNGSGITKNQWLRAGDRVELSIALLGTLVSNIVLTP